MGPTCQHSRRGSKHTASSPKTTDYSGYPKKATRTQIEDWLAHMGDDVCTVLAANNITITVLRNGQLYNDVSPTLRELKASVDSRPVAPAGLFIVQDRSIILRSANNMTFFHEVQHAIDLCLGAGGYRSFDDPQFRRRFADAPNFVTPYAAASIDEFWAESARSWWGAIANDHGFSIWPNVSRERLQAIDPQMYELVRWVFEEEIPRMAAAIRTGAIAV
jgi:hypothetical protein